ncbi:MAG: ankyrin repeat domain-containing protein [Candidatus Cardinium sp.]
MSNEYKKHITGTLISKLADGLVFGLSIVLTTGCEKLSEKYGVKEEQKYGPEMLNERNYIPSESGYRLNKADNGGNSPLHIAVEEGDLAQVKLLIEDQRTDLSKQNNDGNAPLHIAAHRGDVETVKVLLGSSTIVLNAKNRHKETALSISFGEGHKEVCKLLVEANKLLLEAKRTGCDTCCAICWSHPCIDDLYIIRCSHFFHKACLEEWHQNQKGLDKNCPTCKQTIKSVNLR